MRPHIDKKALKPQITQITQIKFRREFARTSGGCPRHIIFYTNGYILPKARNLSFLIRGIPKLEFRNKSGYQFHKSHRTFNVFHLCNLWFSVVFVVTVPATPLTSGNNPGTFLRHIPGVLLLSPAHADQPTQSSWPCGGHRTFLC